jgi:hypothetical protein
MRTPSWSRNCCVRSVRNVPANNQVDVRCWDHWYTSPFTADQVWRVPRAGHATSWCSVKPSTTVSSSVREGLVRHPPQHRQPILTAQVVVVVTLKSTMPSGVISMMRVASEATNSRSWLTNQRADILITPGSATRSIPVEVVRWFVHQQDVRHSISLPNGMRPSPPR